MNDKIILRREKQISPRMPGDLTRQELRDMARLLGIRRGRNTADTLANLKAAGIDNTQIFGSIKP